MHSNEPETEALDNHYEAKFNLKDQDYELLWRTSNRDRLASNKSDINFEEFKQIVTQLGIVIDYWKFKDANFRNKPIRYLANYLFSSHESPIAKKFAKNPVNWSILRENLSPISNLIDNTSKIVSKQNVNLEDKFEFYLIEQIYRLQMDQYFESEDINDYSVYNVNLSRLKFYSDLSKSASSYTSSTGSNDESSVIFTIKTILNYIETVLFMNKSSINYLYENDDTTSMDLKANLDTLNDHLQKLMKNYKNLDSISEFKQGDYFKAFCFIENKWLSSANWLLSTSQSELSIKHLYLFLYALKGSIRFERIDYFEKLFHCLHKMSINNNLHGRSLQGYTNVFKDLLNTQFNTKNTSLENNLNVFLSTLSHMCFVPSKTTIDNLKHFIENLNRSSKDSRWVVYNTNIGTSGRVDGSNESLESAKFDKKELEKISSVIREKILSQEYLRAEKTQELDKIDKLLESSSYDLVVDGMNVIYLGFSQNSFDNITRLINLIDRQHRNKRCLIFLRDHVYKKNISIIESLNVNNQVHSSNNRITFFCIDSIFEDDKFFLYSALKSGPSTFLISNDYFNNQSHFLSQYGNLFKEWLFNRKIITENSFKRFFYPPLYKLKCNQISKNKWILPFLNDQNNVRNHSFVTIEKKYLKSSKNKDL